MHIDIYIKVSSGPVDVSLELWEVWAWWGEEGIKGLVWRYQSK